MAVKMSRKRYVNLCTVPLGFSVLLTIRKRDNRYKEIFWV